MSRTACFVLCALLLLVAAAIPALALGPVDGEVTAGYWFNDQTASGPSVGADAPSVRGELWLFDRWGARAALFRSDPDGGGRIDYGSADLMVRVFSPTENNFFAVGAGWERIDFGAETASGARLVAAGRLSLIGLIHAYGEAAYFPSLGDLTGARDLDGREYDVGIGLEPAPFVTLRIGYRSTSIDMTATGPLAPASGTLRASGYHLGAGIHF